MNQTYEVVVVGAGHAGCEAALAAAGLGCKTLLITMNLDTIAQMSCNPAIGGPAAKSHLVREIDALGGYMGKVIDQSYLNIRLLNVSRGPAVRALRAQADKRLYQSLMTLALQSKQNLDVKLGEAVELTVTEGTVDGIKTRSGTTYRSKTVILATGTFLGGVVVIGDVRFPGGRHGEPAATALSQSLAAAGVMLHRFQTATPPRVHADSIDYSRLNRQDLWPNRLQFSFERLENDVQQMPCWYTQTNQETIRIIRENLVHSPIQSGSVQGHGPRFCPSIDRKVLRFPEKHDHQIFLEPEGHYTKEMYCLGLTTAMPEQAQETIVRSIPGLERARIMRPGYAVEYDYLDPMQTRHTLESKKIRNLFTAGQINGSSGYEEAAAQGIIAGINAAAVVRCKKSLVLARHQGYIGVLIDDLVTKGVDEPYRMMTSRAEYRLTLRQDNADIRLRPLGYEVGLVQKEQYEQLMQKKREIENLLQWLEEEFVSPTEENRCTLQALGSGDLRKRVTLKEILQRPEISFTDLHHFSSIPTVTDDVMQQVQVEAKFSGYIQRQQTQIAKMRRLDDIEIPEEFSYKAVRGIGNEAKEKLERVSPVTLGQARRIPGVSPSDVALLSVALKGG